MNAYSRVWLNCVDGSQFDFKAEDAMFFADLLQTAGVSVTSHTLSFEEVINLNNHLITGPFHEMIHEWSRSSNFVDALRTSTLESESCILVVE